MNDQILHSCPSENELVRYHAKEMAPAEEDAIRAHIANCELCATRSARMIAAHDTWVDRIRTAGVPPPRVTAPPAAEDVLGNDEIPGYEIREEIRRGGQGIVYRAYQQSTKREVAIKVLREGRFASDGARRRFEREVELVAGLRHPHIVTVFDSGRTADGRPYFVMDYVRGQRLGEYIAGRRPGGRAAESVSGGRGRLDEALALFARICEAVNHAHQRGIIHRDLKPSNILVDEEGQPHILDFGLARELDSADATLMTVAGHVAGTLAYMSPEQARGLPDAIDIRSDVYALGVILYELVSGRFPYPVDGDTIEVLRHIAGTEPADIDSTDDELATVVRKALSKERERRYQTAGDLARDVDHYRRGEPIEAKRDSGWYLLRKTVRRYRAGVAVACAFVMLITASAVTFGLMYAHQVRLSEEATRQTELARTAETAAQKRFQDVRALANVFILKLDGMIKRLPGSAPARQTIVENGLKYLDALAAERTDDPELQLEAAAAYMTMGDVQGEIDASTLGDLPGAVDSYDKAIQILETVIRNNPDHANAYAVLMLALLKLSDVHGTLGHNDTMVSSLERVVAIGDRLMAGGSDTTAVRQHLAAAHGRLAHAYRHRGDLDAALRHLETGARLAARVEPNQIPEVERLHNQAVYHASIAQIHYAKGELAEALAGYERFLVLVSEARRVAPDDIVPRRDLAIGHQWVGIIQADMKNHQPAIESFEASVDALDTLLTIAPDDADAQNLQITNLIRLGEVYLAQQRMDEAEAAFQRVVRLSDSLSERQPGMSAVLRNKGVACYKMAELHRALAQAAGTPVAEQAAHQRSTCDWLSRCRDIFVDMRDRGILGPADAGVPDELAAELAECRRQLGESDPPARSE